MSEKLDINIGVIGAGYLGSFHIEQYLTLPGIRLVGFYDLNLKTAKKIKEKYNVNSFETLDELLACCNAVSIASPTVTHYEIAVQSIKRGCHVFIEKPITSNMQEAGDLIDISNKYNRLIQVGHIERFNPAFYSIKDKDIKPLFVESHRLSPFNIRGTDVDVILDLMIHDIDILLALDNSNIKDLRASGVAVLSKNIDTANARIEFDSGCVANITASRISQKKLRKFRFFEKNSYTTIDFLNPSIERYVLTKIKPNKNDSFITISENEEKFIIYDKPNIPDHNALRKELEHFISSISLSSTPMIDGHSGMAALKIAIQIKDYIKNNQS